MAQDNGEILPQETPDESNKIIQINIEEQMKTAYIDYSMSVIVGRALPDVRDGLKPVHRRVLFAMHELGNTFNKPHKKCARIVGEVLGKYHPHGDVSVYDAMVRMAQPWSMRYMMVDGQGNFGSQDGDNPAAMRYTEARMLRLGEAMMEDIEKETVDFSLNFDDTLEEPTVLPTRLPNLLLNGSSGIAVGMATNMMPHNLTEVIDGCLAYIDNNEITIDELMKYVKAPDFPTGGIIYGIEGIKQGMHTGRGRVVLRGRVTVETQKNGKELIIITEVPYQVSRDALAEKIGSLVNNKIIDGITHVGNESNKEGTRVVVELRRDAVAQVVINQLYKYSELQTSYGINNVALVNGRPRTLNLKDLISEFITFRHEVVVRRTNYELKEAKKRAHILEGYLIALDHLDEVIRLIRNSANPEIAKDGLITQFAMSEIQAKAVLELRLQRLTGMEREKIREEHAELMKLIAHLEEILGNQSLRYQIIKDELLDVQKKFGDERKSEIQYMANEMSIEDLIEKEDVVITVSHLGYIKRTSIAEYRAQRRGGRGAIGVFGIELENEEDEVIGMICVHKTDVKKQVLVVSEKGLGKRTPFLEKIEKEENAEKEAVDEPYNLVQIDDDKYLLSYRVTNRGGKGVKTINVTEKTGALIGLVGVEETDDLMITCESGVTIRMKVSAIREAGRATQGVKLINIDEGDKIAAIARIAEQEEEETENDETESVAPDAEAAPEE